MVHTQYKKVTLHKESTIARLTCIAPPLLPSNMLCPENITGTNAIVSVVSPAELCRNLLDSMHNYTKSELFVALGVNYDAGTTRI